MVATRGGMGSYKIADQIDFDAVRADPKPLIGYSDITALHLARWLHCQVIGIHGSLSGNGDASINPTSSAVLRQLMMTQDEMTYSARPNEETAVLSTTGVAEGLLLGGNLDMLATAVGWALPSLRGTILLLEGVEMRFGHMDRIFTMLRKSGSLDGLAGVAVGQFTNCHSSKGITAVELLREHLAPLNVPILGGLPFGHGHEPLSVLLGAPARLDVAAGLLVTSWPD